jgi:hypothetical protein
MRPGDCKWLVLAAIVLAVAFPAVAASKGKGKHHSNIPSCSKVSRKALEDLAQTGDLKLEKKTGPLCIFYGKGLHSDHYKPTLSLEIIPYISSIWARAKDLAQASGHKNGDTFGESSNALFFVSGKQTGNGLQPCSAKLGSPGKGQSKFAPVCDTEPDQSHFSVYGNGTDKRTHLRLMVSAALTGQQGDVHLSHQLELVKEVISGAIH